MHIATGGPTPPTTRTSWQRIQGLCRAEERTRIMWKYSRRRNAGQTLDTDSRYDADSCSDECLEVALHRARVRTEFLERIIDDVVPDEPVWVRTEHDPELIFTYLPGGLSIPFERPD